MYDLNNVIILKRNFLKISTAVSNYFILVKHQIKI